jgi:putative transposase
MHFPYPIEWPQFYTATIHDWLPLLSNENYKKIITDSLNFLIQNRRIELNAFCIMSTHIHLIWQVLPGHTPTSVQLSFMKYTAQQIKFELIKEQSPLLEQCKVEKRDREYQIWKRESLSIELSSEKFFMQKLDYIHYNPVVAGLCNYPEDYHYSSALFYERGVDHFKMLTHYMG